LIRRCVSGKGILNMARAIQSPKKQLARLSVGEMKGALPKLQRRINEINAIDPAQAVGTYTPEFSAIGQNANATLMEIFGSDSVEYERFKILSILRRAQFPYARNTTT
jgi:hypothetical protein